MAISDWFRRRPTSSRPEDLLAALIDGFKRKDYATLMELINKNRDRIRTEFRSWTKVPDRVRQDPAALDTYANTLITLATLFEKSGDPSLKHVLEGGESNNPITQSTDGIADPASRFVIAFADSEGRPLSTEDLPGHTNISWVIHDRGQVNAEARRLHHEGRAAGEDGNHDAAIALFTKAAALDPSWPYPVYDRAFAHLLKQEFDAALADYRKTLELSPLGFFTAAVAVDLLTREAVGEFPHGLYSAFVLLEHMTPQEQQSIAEQLVRQFPSHAPAWQVHAKYIQDPAEKLDAIERGLAARPDIETRGSLLFQKAVTLAMQGDVVRALEALESLRASAGESLATQAKASIAAAMIRSRAHVM